MTSRIRMATRLAPLWLLAFALLAPVGAAQAQPDPDDPAAPAEADMARDEEARNRDREDPPEAGDPRQNAPGEPSRLRAANPPHGHPGHVHGAENPPHGAPGHVHGAENPPHGHPGHVHGAEAAPAPVAGATAPAAPHGAAQGAGGHAAAAADGATLNGDSAAAAVFFWLFALMMVGGSVFVITRRNLISAVMGMVGTFFAIAAVFTMLYAHFLAAIQVLVYAGAIMVLFVFVIMIMNKPEDDPWGRVGRLGNVVAVGLVAYLLWRMGVVLWNVPVTPDMVAPPPDVMVSYGAVEKPVEFGSTMAIGDSLFHEYLFPFEAVSLVLLIAVIGALAVARPHEKQPSATPAPGTHS